MNFVAHRGFWIRKEEQNTIAAFKRAWDKGFGVETDLRDVSGRVVISHDPPRDNCLELEHFFEQYKKFGAQTKLALNIKSDGLFYLLREQLGDFGITNYFVFDMSVPDTFGYLRLNLKVFVRRSEFEPVSRLSDFAEGFWFDELENNWIEHDDIISELNKGKEVCVVSPELHGRVRDWNRLRSLEKYGTQISLCTDFPQDAQEFFYGKD